MRRRYETQHVATVPPGYHVRTVRSGAHEVRIAFPPGSRKRGSGKVVEVLHPVGENSGCLARSNPMELLVMGANPMRSNPIDQFTQTEKMHLGMLGIKWSEIKSRRDVNHARAKLRKFEKLRSRSNPSAAAVESNPNYGFVPGAEPESIAKEIYEGFHQAEADRFSVMDEPHIPRGEYAQLGTLYSLHVKPAAGPEPRYVKNLLRPGAPIRVISSESRRQIYFAGGSQAMTDRELADFGCGPENLCELGEVRQIWYLARKNHAQLEEEYRGKVVNYRHAFGSKGAVKPVLFYNRRMKRLLLQGGDYEVLDEGIEN